MLLLPFSSTELLASWPGLVQASASVGSLVLLEAVLSADNAVALAGLVADVKPVAVRTKILNQGLVLAFILRALTIILAAWMIRFEALKIVGGLYLIWLAVKHFQEQFKAERPETPKASTSTRESWRLMGLIACTDLAFSIDSVTAAVAMCDNVMFVLVGGALGVLLLRFLAGRMMVWMARYLDLANAAYLTVLAVGLRMLARSLAPALDPPQAGMIVIMIMLFVWGFSRRAETDNHQELDQTSRSTKGTCKIPSLISANTATL